jgi:uncharacterized membrane protein YphA (DoxX/SURF4 family)
MFMKARLRTLDLKIIACARRLFMPVARIAFFVIFFYFGFLKLIGVSPATPLAEALTAQTIGMESFHVAYIVLAAIECLIGILFLIPRATRIVIPLLIVHLAVVSSPLLLVPSHSWLYPLVPSLEGQYIIKNIALIAAAIGIAANVPPLQKAKQAAR